VISAIRSTIWDGDLPEIKAPRFFVGYIRSRLRFEVSHPFDEKMSNGWGTGRFCQMQVNKLKSLCAKMG